MTCRYFYQAAVTVERVAKRLIYENNLQNGDRDWKFLVIDSAIPNAFVTPGINFFQFRHVLCKM